MGRCTGVAHGRHLSQTLSRRLGGVDGVCTGIDFPTMHAFRRQLEQRVPAAALVPVMEKYGFSFGNLPPELTFVVVAGPLLLCLLTCLLFRWLDALSVLGSFFQFALKGVLLGVGLGAAIHGWVPEDFFARFAGPENPFAVIVATVAGLPLYVNGAGVVPVGEALWSKGMSLGTVMAFMMSSIALSIPQAVMLRRVLKPPLLALFFGAVAVGIMALGFLFNLFG